MTNRNTGQHDSGWLQAAAYLEDAWQWLCERREHAPAQACVWHLRHHWQREQPVLLRQLLAGEYRLSPLQVVGRGSDRKAMWSARDALVLKWVALQVAPLLPLHARCEHVRGHGGGPASVARLSAALTGQGYTRVLRTDVKGYYANMDKAILLSQVRKSVTQPGLLALITQYVHYTVEDGGTFHTPEKGISRSCPLSPLMGALYLQEMDVHFAGEMARGRMYYARYMDDIVILAHTRWQLRKHVRRLNQFLAEKHVRQHPDKTFIGKTARGFDWMGAWLEPEGVTDIAPRAKAGHRERVRRLYERAWRRREPEAVTRRRVSAYRWRWTIWACALLGAQATAHAATLRVVVPAGASGIVGVTPVVAGTVAGSVIDNGFIGMSGIACLTPMEDSLCPMTWMDTFQLGSTGVWGVKMDGPTPGGVALADGVVNWNGVVRNDPTSEIDTSVYAVQGQTVLSNGRTMTSWSPPRAMPGGTPPPIASDPDGTVDVGSPSGGRAIWSGYMGVKWSTSPVVASPTGSARGASVRVRFFIDAPPGGLAPGAYSIVPIYLQVSQGGDLQKRTLLVDGFDVEVADYSCTLGSSVNNVTLAPGTNETAGLQLTARCSDGTPASTVGATYKLTAEHTGVSQTGADPRDLTVSPEAAGLTVRGAWSATPPACSGGDVYFDGSEGPTVMTLSPGQTNQVQTRDMAFRLCGTAPPGAYTAQMTVRLVGR